MTLQWKVSKPGTNFAGYPIPVGAVYCVLPLGVPGRGHATKTCVWVVDLDLAYNNNHFVVYSMRVGQSPRRMYVSGGDGWPASAQAYIRLNGLKGKAKPQIYRRDIAPIAPKLRRVGEYSQRGCPNKEERDTTMTDNFVTNGCRVGKNFYREESYCTRVMGQSTPNYNR